MHIFIDESGPFVRGETRPSISAVGALVVPNYGMSGFEKLYARLRRTLPKDTNGEVKGRLLSEGHIPRVVDVLRKVGCLFEVVIMDHSVQSDEEVRTHQKIQAQKITENLDENFSEKFKDQVYALRTELERMTPQLYLQSVSMGELLYSTLFHANIYYAFRHPKELGNYYWVIDAKGANGITRWEKWWSDTISPFMESKCARNPLAAVEGADWSAHERFRIGADAPTKKGLEIPADADVFDIGAVLKENMRFSSDSEPGLECVDILVNTIRRSMVGNFRREGWLPVRELMVNRRPHCLNLVHVGQDQHRSGSHLNRQLVQDFRNGGRALLRPSDYSKTEVGDGE